MKETTQLEKLEVYYQQDIGRSIDALAFIQQHRALLERANVKPCIWGKYVDYDGLNRPQILQLLRTFGGKWDKSAAYSDGHLRYTKRETVDGRTIRVSGEPPASCKVVETVKWVKVPARREKQVTRTVVCK